MREGATRSTVPPRQQELACSRRTKGMRLDHLALPPRKVCGSIKQRTDGIDIRGQIPAIILNLKKDTVVSARVPIHATRRKGIFTWLASLRGEMSGAGDRHAGDRRCAPTSESSAASGIDEVAVRR